LVLKHGHGVIQNETTDAKAQAREMLLMGLRIDEGIDLNRYEGLAGKTMDQNKITAMADLGLVEMRGNARLAATLAGRRLLNAVIAELAD
jgi:coproporphyrinogen III oxidase-like Fe-S oxidoreductase